MMWEFEENPIMIEEFGEKLPNSRTKSKFKRGVILEIVLLEY
jgi:hypothetical protein